MNTMSKRTKKLADRNRTIKGQALSQGLEVAHYAKVIKLLRPTGTPLLTAVSRYAQAVKILGGDRILEAAKDFVRHGDHTVRKSRKPRKIRKPHKVHKPRTICKSRVVRKSRAIRKPRIVRKVADKLIALKKRRVATKREPITICTPNELRGLLAAAPGWFRPIVAIQAFAGLHSTELLRLDWEDVKLDRGHIEVGKHRTRAGARRLAPIPPNLVRWLTYAAKSSGKVFPYSRANLDEIQADTATAADVGWKDNALRHSFISYRVAQTSDVPRVSLESGTSPGRIFKHYRTLVGEMDARQWFIIAP
jgi:integrase